MKTWKTLATLGLGVALAAPAAAQTKELNFGLISTESSANLKSAWQPVFDDMSKATGIKVTAFFAPNYAGVIEAMRFNKVQVAWMGNKSAMEAVDRASAEVFAKIVGKDGTEGYYSLLVVHKDSPLKSLEDVLKQRKELTLGFGDPNSTSGTAVPGLFAFANNQVDPVKDFKRTVRANHETNLLAVVNKQVDVATNNTEAVDRLTKTHPDQATLVREIWRSPQIPSDPIVWRHGRNRYFAARACGGAASNAAHVVGVAGAVGGSFGPAGRELAWRRHAPSRVGARLGQYGAVRQGLLPAQLWRVALLPERVDHHARNCALGHGLGGGGLGTLGAFGGQQYRATLGVPTRSPHAGRASAGRGAVWRASAGHALVVLVHAVPRRIQCALGVSRRNGGRWGRGHGIVGRHPRLSVSADSCCALDAGSLRIGD